MALSILQVISFNEDSGSLHRQLNDLCGMEMCDIVLEIVEHRIELLTAYEVSSKLCNVFSMYRYSISFFTIIKHFDTGACFNGK